MTKLEMAHEYALRMIINGSRWGDGNVDSQLKNISINAWKLADAMQAEAKKRSDMERPDFSNMADSPQLDDCDHHWRELQDHKVCKICNKQEGYIPWGGFQPDWSVAPEWANYWVKSRGCVYLWVLNKPTMTEDYFASHGKAQIAPSFGYQGSWENSLRKRP